MQPAKDSSVAVVGLGKIGLPLAAQFASKGLDVVGCDVLPEVVESINAGRAHIHEEAGLEQAVAAAVAAGKLKATTDTSTAVAKADVVVVIVPLMVSLDRDIDYRSLDAATRAVGRGLRKGSLVIFETTLPVGTTRQRLGPMLEKESGLRAGADFHLAFSPERLYAGRIFEDLRKYPKIVGGIDERSTERALQFYRSVLDAEVWAVDNAETAEFTKLAETTYRDVNIALANQFALYAARRDVNVGQAFEAANSQPFSHIHRPSLGVGGHCIPVYPHFMLGDASNGELSLVRDGRQTNDHMAEVGVEQLERALGGLNGRRVLVLGASYREDVKELAFSTAFSLVDLLRRAGAEVLIHDPLFTTSELANLEAEVVDLASDQARSVDAIVVQAMHRDFRDLDWRSFQKLRAVLDGRGTLDAEKIRRAGAAYIAIGISESRAAAPK
ncbi:MAG TPA: nucleotide sugar dehydrogenase [Candidatus Sulfotelmatobacter sp.]|nr:nucleotide sugar dehydrogenase [Candidatus Sulfotelmatobacter sp.]